MNKLLNKKKTDIENMIYKIRNQQVMLASDVALLYNEETRRINEVVKRNSTRFPSDFCFQLTKDEYDTLRSQFAISDQKNGGNRYLPYVFTKHGIMMLSGLLKSEVAANVNVA